MTTYQLFYDEVLVGTLEINEEGLHRFTPMEECSGYDRIVPMLLPQLRVASCWGNPIAFLANRIHDAAQFGITDEISAATDHYLLRKISK